MSNETEIPADAALHNGIRHYAVMVRDALMTWAYASEDERRDDILLGADDPQTVTDYFEHLSKFLDVIIVGLADGGDSRIQFARKELLTGAALTGGQR